MRLNIMIDSRDMWPEPYHIMDNHMNRTFTGEVKKPFTRTAKAPKYYIINYRLSRRYPPDDPHLMEIYPEGGDRTVPEFNNSTNPIPHDPFAVDIYCVGNVMRECIIDVGCHLICESTCDLTDFVKRRRILAARSSNLWYTLCWSPIRRSVQQLGKWTSDIASYLHHAGGGSFVLGYLLRKTKDTLRIRSLIGLNGFQHDCAHNDIQKCIAEASEMT